VGIEFGPCVDGVPVVISGVAVVDILSAVVPD